MLILLVCVSVLTIESDSCVSREINLESGTSVISVSSLRKTCPTLTSFSLVSSSGQTLNISVTNFNHSRETSAQLRLRDVLTGNVVEVTSTQRSQVVMTSSGDKVEVGGVLSSSGQDINMLIKIEGNALS